MVTSRQLPNSINSRKKALDIAFAKKNNPGPSGNFLTTPTSDRLDAAHANYTSGALALNAARFALHSATPTKAEAFRVAQLTCRHFVMVFNLGVTRGVYTAAERSFFSIEISDDTAPTVNAESDLIQVCQNILSGNDARLAAGGAPMANPSIADLQAAYDNFNNLHSAYSNLKDSLDIAQEALEAQQEETDNVILKVWDEVETFYNEEEKESQRANAHEWGVHYVTRGNAKDVDIDINVNDGAPLPENAQVLLQDEPLAPNETGNAIYNTTMEGELTLQITGDGIVPYNGVITVLPDVNQVFVVEVERVV